MSLMPFSLLCLCAGMLLLAACDSQPPTDNTTAGADTTVVRDTARSVQITSKDINVLYSQNATVRLNLIAPTRLRYTNGDEEYPDSLTIYIFDEKGRRTTTLTAQKGFYEGSHRKYRVQGLVNVYNEQEKQRLETDTLHWDQQHEQIFTDARVKVTTQSEILRGTGLKARQDFSQYKILKPTGIMSVTDP